MMRTLEKMTWVELKLFIREPLTVVFTFAIPLVLLYVLGGVFGNKPSPGFYRGVGAMNYYIPAYIALVIAAIGLIVLPVHIAAYRERGVLRRFRASSIPLGSVFGAQVAVTFIIGVLASLLVAFLGTLTYQTKGPHSPVGVMAAFVLGALTFAVLGVFLGLALPTARAAQGAGVMLWFTLMMISGTGPPPEVLPGSLRTVADFAPLQHVVILVQDPWLGFGWNWGQTLVVGAFLMGLTILTALLARRG
ncbi:MAG: ABC transporter permease [Ktedonobacterales bacterium]